jgi:outer membrane protein assembly factor BamB
VVDDGIAYVADLEQVRALDSESGAVLWSFPDQPNTRAYGPFYTVALLPDEALYVTSVEKLSGGFFAQPQGVLRALSVVPDEPEGRRELWRFTEASGDYVGGGAAAGGILVIGNGDGSVYALDAGNGALLWQFATGGRVWARPLITSDVVYVSSLDHSLYAFDLESGQLRWEFAAAGALASPPLLAHGRLYVGSFDHKVYALDPEDGDVVWAFEGRNWIWGTPAADDSRVYAADVDGNVYAVDAETGNPVWEAQVPDLVHLGPQLSQEGDMLLLAGNEGNLYGLDTSDGVVLWTKPGDGQLASLVVQGEFVYVSRIFAEERVQAFYAENGRNLWTFSPSDSG